MTGGDRRFACMRSFPVTLNQICFCILIFKSIGSCALPSLSLAHPSLLPSPLTSYLEHRNRVWLSVYLHPCLHEWVAREKLNFTHDQRVSTYDVDMTPCNLQWGTSWCSPLFRDSSPTSFPPPTLTDDRTCLRCTQRSTRRWTSQSGVDSLPFTHEQ